MEIDTSGYAERGTIHLASPMDGEKYVRITLWREKAQLCETRGNHEYHTIVYNMRCAYNFVGDSHLYILSI